jgi:hypothetical protein
MAAFAVEITIRIALASADPSAGGEAETER